MSRNNTTADSNQLIQLKLYRPLFKKFNLLSWKFLATLFGLVMVMNVAFLFIESSSKFKWFPFKSTTRCQTSCKWRPSFYLTRLIGWVKPVIIGRHLLLKDGTQENFWIWEQVVGAEIQQGLPHPPRQPDPLDPLGPQEQPERLALSFSRISSIF